MAQHGSNGVDELTSEQILALAWTGDKDTPMDDVREMANAVADVIGLGRPLHG